MSFMENQLVQYQKQVRLLHARSVMSAGGKSVMSTALEVGYESPTQFCREYARAFGLSPKRDVSRILAATGSDALQR
jgi:AraC-like DNA-binding protein